VSQRDNAVAEPSRSAGDYDGVEGDTGERDTGELSGAAVAGELGGPGASASAEPAATDPADGQADPAPGELDDDAGTGEADEDEDAGADGADDYRTGGGADEDGTGGGADEDGTGDGAAAGPEAAGRDEDGARAVADLELEGEIAADYVEGLLDVADLDGDIDMDVEGDRAMVSVVGATLDELVGPRGEVLEALQELTRLAVHRQTGVRTRIMLDVGGYRQRRRAELAEAGREVADEVRQTGRPKKMWAMNRFERKIVHDAVAAAGLRSESEGEEPDRKVVVLPAE
jgi:spoIIIJ-associated protein